MFALEMLNSNRSYPSSTSRWTAMMALFAALVLPSIAAAAPVTYSFVSGMARVRAILDDGNQTSVLSGVPAIIPLGGTAVTFDAAGGPSSMLLDLQIIPMATINLDLDESVVGIDTISVVNAAINYQAGQPSLVLPTGEFYAPTIVTADVSGFLPGGFPFGPVPVTSLNSASYGSLWVSGNTITLDVQGINIAQFAQLFGNGPNVIVKADFTFVGTIIPEPGTALLMGLGLGLLSRTKSARARR